MLSLIRLPRPTLKIYLLIKNVLPFSLVIILKPKPCQTNNFRKLHTLVIIKASFNALFHQHEFAVCTILHSAKNKYFILENYDAEPNCKVIYIQTFYIFMYLIKSRVEAGYFIFSCTLSRVELRRDIFMYLIKSRVEAGYFHVPYQEQS